MLPQAFPNRCTSVKPFPQMYESAVDVPGRVSLLTWSSVAMGHYACASRFTVLLIAGRIKVTINIAFVTSTPVGTAGLA